MSIELWVGFLGWQACCFVLVGTLFLWKKAKFGWVMRAIGDLEWVLVGLLTGLIPVAFCEAVFFIIDIVGYFLWRKDELDGK